ncbi:MAG: hypothetical protein CM1200mP1_09030 [Candidatus Neomarinimicrobiota bacterium]|nr:MAG: hypothetical protein CM1200mP1_09030 [Candidatus Neomarinimicrobiota bacterium]
MKASKVVVSWINRGQTTNAIFGGRSAAQPSKITTYLAVAFMGLALLISLLGHRQYWGDSVIEKAQEDGLLIPLKKVYQSQLHH